MLKPAFYISSWFFVGEINDEAGFVESFAQLNCKACATVRRTEDQYECAITLLNIELCPFGVVIRFCFRERIFFRDRSVFAFPSFGTITSAGYAELQGCV